MKASYKIAAIVALAVIIPACSKKKSSYSAEDSQPVAAEAQAADQKIESPVIIVDNAKATSGTAKANTSATPSEVVSAKKPTPAKDPVKKPVKDDNDEERTESDDSDDGDTTSNGSDHGSSSGSGYGSGHGSSNGSGYGSGYGSGHGSGHDCTSCDEKKDDYSSHTPDDQDCDHDDRDDSHNDDMDDKDDSSNDDADDSSNDDADDSHTDDSDDNDDVEPPVKDLVFCFANISEINAILQLRKIPHMDECKITDVIFRDFVRTSDESEMSFNYERIQLFNKDIVAGFKGVCGEVKFRAAIHIPINGICVNVPTDINVELTRFPEHMIGQELPVAPKAPEVVVPEAPKVPEYKAPKAPEAPEAPEYQTPEAPKVPEYNAPEAPAVPEAPKAPEYNGPEEATYKATVKI